MHVDSPDPLVREDARQRALLEERPVRDVEPSFVFVEPCVRERH
jgi:hypothetical protein